MRRFKLLFLSLICLVNIAWMWRENPKVAEYMQQGFQAYNEGNLNEALNSYENALMLRPDKLEAINFIGVIYEEMNLPEKAEEKYLTSIKIDNDYLPAYYNLGLLYWNGGDRVKAKYYLEIRVKKGNPKDPWTIKAQQALKSIDVSVTKDRQEIINEAVDEISPKPKTKPYVHLERSTEDKNRRGLVYRTLDQVEQHKEVKDEIKYTSKDLTKEQTNTLFTEAQELADKGRYDDAIIIYDQALHITPGDPQIIKARVDTFMKSKQKSNNWK